MNFSPSTQIKSVGLVFISIWLASISLLELHQSSPKPLSNPQAEVLYLPKGDGIKFLSFGYHNAVSGLLWLNTVSYFGKHYSTDKQYHWLHHMCGLVTTLNPLAYNPYYFCSTMMAWETNQPRVAVKILSEGIVAHKQDWFFLYLRGFYQLHFLKHAEAAKKDFMAASLKPGAHPIAARLAAKNISELENPQNAIAFLKGMVQNAQDEYQRSALQHKLDELLSKVTENHGARID